MIDEQIMVEMTNQVDRQQNERIVSSLGSDTTKGSDVRVILKSLIPMCIVAFLMNCKPSEPFLTEILVTSKNVTTTELEQEVWPTFTYSFVVFVLPIGIAADSWSHRGVILLGLVFRLFTRAILFFGSGLTLMRFMQFTFAIATATEGALFSFVYRVVPGDWFLRGTSMVYLSYHLGNVFGSLFGQLSVDGATDSAGIAEPDTTQELWLETMTEVNSALLASSAVLTLCATGVFLISFPVPKYAAPSATLYDIVSAHVRSRAPSLQSSTQGSREIETESTTEIRDSDTVALDEGNGNNNANPNHTKRCAPSNCCKYVTGILRGMWDVLKDIQAMYKRGGVGLALWTAWNVVAYGAASVWFNYYQLQLFEANPRLRRWGYIEMFNEVMHSLGSALPALVAGGCCVCIKWFKPNPALSAPSFSLVRDAKRLTMLSLVCAAALLWSGLVSSTAINAHLVAKETNDPVLDERAIELGERTVIYSALLNGVYVMVLGAQVTQSSAAVAWYARADARYPVLFSINTFGSQVFASILLQIGTTFEWSALEFVYATAGLNFVVVVGALIMVLVMMCCWSRVAMSDEQEIIEGEVEISDDEQQPLQQI